MKQLNPNSLHKFPSGGTYYPSRLIHRDGTLMWKHACVPNNSFIAPPTEQVEENIIQTAKRLEELNTWISPTMPAWDTFNVYLWFHPSIDDHISGGTVRFGHDLFTCEHLYNELTPHLQEGESLIFNAISNVVVYHNGRLTAASVSRDNSDCQQGG